MKIEEVELTFEDLDTMVEIARTNMNTGAWLGVTHSAVVLRTSLEKQVPKEVKNIVHDDFTYGYCPNCTKYLADDEIYCPKCGQALKWDGYDTIEPEHKVHEIYPTLGKKYY